MRTVGDLNDEMYDHLETVNFSILKSKPVLSNDNKDEVYATIGITLELATLKVNVDTGAQGNILPDRIFKAMFPGTYQPTLEKCATVLTGYDGSKIQHSGYIILRTEPGT